MTLGTLSVNGVPKYVTVERPWLDNQRSVSCIPCGTYHARIVSRANTGQRLQDTFKNVDYFILVEGVPNRDGIYFHPANKAEDLEGCIGPGIFFGELKDRSGKFVDGVLDSTHALQQLIERLLDKDEPEHIKLGDTFFLTIK